MISIRQQLTRQLLVATVVLLSGGVAALYWFARDAATEQFDRALQAKALAVSTMTTHSSGRVRVGFTDRFLKGFDGYRPRDFFQLRDEQGETLARSESLRRNEDLPSRTGSPERPARWNFTLPNGRPGRALGYVFRPLTSEGKTRDASPRLALVVASDRSELDEDLWELLGWCVGWGGLLVGATLVVIPRVLRRGLKSLDRVAEQAATIDADTLGTRFTSDELPAELQPIAYRLNDLLARLERSFERERRFSADLAHELRTPLAELRTLAECALKWPETRDPAVDRDTLAIAEQMERMVAQILALARSEEGPGPAGLEQVALDALVTEVWRRFAARAAARELQVELRIAPISGCGDPALLCGILANLFENAVEYAPAGAGGLLISLEEDPAGPVLSVTNPAPELEPEDVAKLFDRFWRKEAARTGGLHAGLGLSLARAFAKTMGWSLTALLDNGRLTMELRGKSIAGHAAAAPQ